MDASVVRYRMTALLDDLAGRWVVGPGTRAIVAAVKAWLPGVPDAEMQRLGDFLPANFATGGEDMADDLYPYCPSLSTHAIADVAGYFRGQVPLGHAVHAAENILSYGLSVYVPDPGEPIMALALPAGEDAAQVIEKARPGADGAVRGLAIPWAIILQLATQVILAWLHNQPA